MSTEVDSLTAIDCNLDQSQTIINEACCQLHNREQQFTFNQFHQLPDGIGLIHGPAGIRKTLLLATLISAYHKLGAHIIITVPLNLTADTLLQQLITIDPKNKPMRIYWDIFKDEESHHSAQPLVTDSKAAHVTVEISVIHQIKTEQHFKAFSLSEHSLTWTMMKHATDALNGPAEYV